MGPFPQLPINSYLKADDEMAQHDTGLSSSEDMNMGRQKMKRHDAMENNYNCHSLQAGGEMLGLDIIAINSTFKLDVNSFSEASEHLNISSNCVDISSINKHDDHVDTDTVLHEERSTKTYKWKRVETDSRKMIKVSDSLVNTLESNKEGTNSSMLNLAIVPNGRRNTNLDLSEEALPSGCLTDMLVGEMVAGHDSSLNVVEDSLLKDPLGESSVLEHARTESKNMIQMENEDSFVNDVSLAECAGENEERAEIVELIVNAVCDVNSVEEKGKESAKSCEDKACGDSSAYGPPIETVDQKIQSKMEDAIASLPELDAKKENATQVVNKEISHPQIFQSSMGRAHSGCPRKKLLVLDVNGLLADIVTDASDIYKPDTIIGRKAVFKRPFCDDFLQFCFERFSVGVWSSRIKKNVERVIDFLMGNTGNKLLFCWDQSQCTETGFNTVENRDKPLFLKELKKLWEKQDPNLPWDRGDYDASNTLLLDDSPYKALRNPQNTAIFPHTFQYWNMKDNSLGPGGNLRVYLEGLAAAENVQKYVEQNPFGQRPITKTNLSWRFYLKVIGTTSSELEDDVDGSSAANDANTSLS